MTRLPWIWPAIILGSTAAVSIVTFGDIGSPIRAVIAVWFLLICPGMAFVRLLRLKEGITEFTLALALSLAMDTIVATAMLYAGVWSPKGGLLMLIWLTMSGVALQIMMAYRRRSGLAPTE